MSTTPPAPGTPKFCRQCGAALRPNVRFCHHCGAPVAAPGVVPAPGATVPAAHVVPPPPATAPQPIPVAAVPTPAGPAGTSPLPQGALLAAASGGSPRRQNWFSRLPALAKLGLIFFGLVLIGGAVQASLPSAAQCTYSCIIISGPLQPTGKHFSGPTFSFYYPPILTETKSPSLGATVSFASNDGPVNIWSGHGSQTPTALVQKFAQTESTNIQDVTPIGPMFGAQIGFVPGSGEFYTGQVTLTNGTVLLIGLGIVAANTGSSWAAIAVGAICTDAANGSSEGCSEAKLDSQQENFGFSQSYDDVLSHWTWGS